MPAVAVRRRTGRTLVALAIAVGLSLSLDGAASATEDTQTTCSEYTSGSAWGTSTKWGRVSIQGCMEFTTTEVRPIVQIRTDWPSDCSTTYGVTAIFERQCETLRGFKNQELDFHSIMIPNRYTGPGKARVDGGCTFEDVTATMPFLGGDVVYTCTGDWEPIQQGATYTIDFRNAQADVKDDGKGNRTLEGAEENFQEFGGTFVLA
jgi:hypothetical protein